MREKLGKYILALFGWKIVNTPPSDIKKCILVGAPHTSNWDYIIGVFGAMSANLSAKFLIKSEVFFFPVGPILKFFGGVPVERGKKSNLVDQLADFIRDKERIHLVFTPEGTRQRVNRWKTGFYNVAQKANIPMILCYLDYKKKEGGFGPVIYPSGNYKEDLKKIKRFYSSIHPKYPHLFNPHFN